MIKSWFFQKNPSKSSDQVMIFPKKIHQNLVIKSWFFRWWNWTQFLWKAFGQTHSFGNAHTSVLKRGFLDLPLSSMMLPANEAFICGRFSYTFSILFPSIPLFFHLLGVDENSPNSPAGLLGPFEAEVPQKHLSQWKAPSILGSPFMEPPILQECLHLSTRHPQKDLGTDSAAFCRTSDCDLETACWCRWDAGFSHWGTRSHPFL